MRLDIDPDETRSDVLRSSQGPGGSGRPNGMRGERKLSGKMHQALSLHPRILKAWRLFTGLLLDNDVVERSLKEKIAVRVSEVNDCPSCRLGHSRRLAQLGHTEEQIGNARHARSLTEREKVVFKYAEQVSLDAHGVSDDLFAQLKQHFSREAIVELTMMIAMMNMQNRFNTALEI